MLPREIMGATSLRTRPSWPAFRDGPLYPSFLDAVRKMRANSDSTRPGSWAYWTNVHANYCPHRKPYFLAWHRGFLVRFEAQLRKASGNSALVLPYWNYYEHPMIPAEFRDSTSPLYQPNRTGSDVSGACTLGAFDPTLINFQRGKTDAFEPAVETAPHNGVHNLIGGAMDNISISPRDPIFWVHHANIDRLWDAWVLAGDGRHMPAKTASYWSGSFHYGTAVSSVKRVNTYAPSILGYRYDDTAMPASQPNNLAAPLPSIQEVFATPLAVQGGSLGGVGGLALGPRSARVRIPLTEEGRNRVRSRVTTPGQAADAVRIVLDGVDLTSAGARGGFFYKILLNLPAQGLAQPEQTYLVGTLGPFEISVARHARMMAGGGSPMAMNGPVRLVLPARDVLSRIWPEPLDALTVSFVRVDAGGAPQSDAIAIDRVSVEAD
ncbi:MAG TPA: tyrosinase family protein [Frateuria sp.]|uniref:tyrosinase family protein n=1 Tax=Frateuria sp. TaxID=2211372 RepID=UPI002D7FA0E4|nr:tyrosinase family protein [Frateuria sp.]HET6805494.1 tyrosinase family protein [Frateuria sp.]